MIIVKKVLFDFHFETPARLTLSTSYTLVNDVLNLGYALEIGHNS